MKFKNKNLIVISIILLFLVLACGFDKIQKEADSKFGDQHFKTAISLIELHKTRFGEYPKSLNDLKFIGEWDKIIFGSVEYKRLESGYELNLTKGWVGKPELNYPDDFWNGLGLVKSNVKQEKN